MSYSHKSKCNCKSKLRRLAAKPHLAVKMLISVFYATLLFVCTISYANAQDSSIKSTDTTSEDKAVVSCISSFNQTRKRVLEISTQSVILLSNSSGIVPFISLQSPGSKGRHYALWQTLNGDVKGYALRDGKGFDYANSAGTPSPLSWHPTLIWDNIFGSNIPLKNYSCVLTGRTRVMGKRVSLIRLIPQESLRYSFIIAKEDESNFPVELSILDNRGNVASRLTTMDSRIIAGFDFPIGDKVYDRVAKINDDSGSQSDIRSDAADSSIDNGIDNSSDNIYGLTSINHGTYHDDADATNARMITDKKESSLRDNGSVTKDNSNTGLAEIISSGEKQQDKSNSVIPASGSLSGELANGDSQAYNSITEGVVWPELNIPKVYKMVNAGLFPMAGPQCVYQEFSDGLTSFRVYRNTKSKIFYPVVNNGTLTVFRKNSSSYEYSVVGEVPLNLAEFVLTKISER